MCVHAQACTHIADVVLSVGPVRGAAVARLIDLALLLQAAGLAALAGSNLNTDKQYTSTTLESTPLTAD